MYKVFISAAYLTYIFHEDRKYLWYKTKLNNKILNYRSEYRHIFRNILEGIMDKCPYNEFNLESSQETDHLKAVPESRGIFSAQQHPFLCSDTQCRYADLELLVKLELSESYIYIYIYIYNIYYYVLIMMTYVSWIEILASGNWNYEQTKITVVSVYTR